MEAVMPNKTNGKVEGEGSYKGTRQYNAHLKEWIETGKVEESADRARKALEDDGAELREAEAKARSGPDKKNTASGRKNETAPKKSAVTEKQGNRAKRGTH
jgi:hypothetical protein